MASVPSGGVVPTTIDAIEKPVEEVKGDIPESYADSDKESEISPHAQAGVAAVEATTKIWSKRDIIIAYGWYVRPLPRPTLRAPLTVTATASG